MSQASPLAHDRTTAGDVRIAAPWQQLGCAVALLLVGDCRRTAPPPPVVPAVPAFYTSEAIDTHVVDETTMRPIAGACVVAVWREINTLDGQWHGVFRREEFTTDSDGNLRIPRWGPRPPRPGTCLDQRDPELWVIRRGYGVTYFDNTGRKWPRGPVLPDDQFLVVKLPPAKMQGHNAWSQCRSADASSLWSNRDLSIAGRSEIDVARALAAGDPGQPGSPALAQDIPLYWKEWQSAVDALPPDIRRQMPKRPYSPVEIFILR